LVEDTPLREDVDISGHSDASTPIAEGQEELAEWLSDERHEGSPIATRLKASDRVIARVTDGIYREPYAALREVISNAWDADANEVTILTDAPRFSRIYIRDDGMGMTHETLSRLLHHIGGSAKRTKIGADLRVTAEDDRDKSPGGRMLIGKIGIGLFSVSQLSRRFKIVTKVQGEPYRLIAEVSLRPYSEDAVGPDDDEDASFVNGEVFILRERASDVEAHGTDLILDDIKPGVREILRSADRWRAMDERDQARDDGDTETVAEIKVESPEFHAGWIPDLPSSPRSPAILHRDPALPWDSDTPPSERMACLMDAVESQSARKDRPALETTLDKYLQTIWQLGLSAPVPYVDRHPFDLTSADEVLAFWMPPSGERPIEVPLEGSETVRDAVHRCAPGNPMLRDGLEPEGGPFRVTVDGVELKRPIRFGFRPTQKRGLQRSMLFVGAYSPDLSQITAAQRGGNLDLEGYLFWNGRVIPKENNGVLVRIRGAAGAAFDPTFMDYQVSEQTRLRQITAEVFIQDGLDAALNIDRESFNFAHPHVQLLHRWLHRGIRQLTNRHKELTKRLRDTRRSEETDAARDDLDTWADDIWTQLRGSAEPPDIELTDSDRSAEEARAQGSVSFPRSSFSNLQDAPRSATAIQDARIRALLKLIAAYGLFEDRPFEDQRAFVDDVLRIFLDSPTK
jgi:hypothetical protein